MLAISVELLHGTFRGDPDGTANTGRLTRGEWPPSPARLFAALVAADGTRQKCLVTDGAELAWFERLPPPVIHADSRPWHQPLQPRYVVRHEGSPSKSTHQEYVGRSGALNRAGVRVAPRDPHVIYSWDVESPTYVTLEALRRRAALIDFPSEKAFKASDDVPFRPSIRPASDDIVDRRLVIAHTDHDGSMEGGVRLSVAAPIEAVSTGGHPGGGGDGTRAAELGKGGFRANPLRVIPEDN